MSKVYFSYSGAKKKIAMPEGPKKERIRRKSTFIDTNRMSDLPRVDVSSLLKEFGFKSSSEKTSLSAEEKKTKNDIKGD